MTEPGETALRGRKMAEALGLRVALKLSDREWEQETKRHLGGVAISRADVGALDRLILALRTHCL